MPRHQDGRALSDRRTNKNAAGLEVLAALNSNLAAIRSLLSDYRVNLQPAREDTGSGRTCQGILRMGTVTGAEPFFVPSQPGMDRERRPVVAPAATTSLSSRERHIEMTHAATVSRPLQE